MATLRTPMANMNIALGQELARGLQTAADQWNITPTAAAKQILKEALQKQGHLPPAPVHRTLRLATTLTRWIQHTAHRNSVPWRSRRPTATERRRAALDVRVRIVFETSGRTYGSPGFVPSCAPTVNGSQKRPWPGLCAPKAW